MAIQVIYLRDYEISVHDSIVATIKVYNDKSKTSYAALPTIAEIREALGESATGETVREIHLSNCFSDCDSLVIAPDIPDGVTNMSGCFLGCSSLNVAPTIPNGVTNMAKCFYGCDSLVTAPIIPNGVINLGGCFSQCRLLNNAPDIPSSVTAMNDCFSYCTSLRTAPDIPNSVTHMKYCFAGCTVLDTAPTIPNSVTNMAGCFYDCTELTGKITINANPSTYSSCMEGTEKNIVLVGSSTLLQNIADTANNGNVYVWSLSINLSAERQENDFSKANVSVVINRFRNNNESVSLTFTINSVESTPVQVTMDTATKTYTGVLSITPSSIVELSVIAEDSYGKSAPKSITIPIPFYTIDFQAGGKEIAVGAPANDDTSNRPYGLFKCVMDAQFGRNVEFDGELALGTALSIANGGTGAKTAAAARTNLGVTVANLGLSGAQVKTLLWTNASPTSSFANQTLSLGLSSYEAVEIEFCYGSSYTNVVETGIYKKSYTQQYMTCHGDIKTNNTGFYISQRLVTVTASGITFGKGIYKNVSAAANGAANNVYCVPLKIYGVKGV